MNSKVLTVGLVVVALIAIAGCFLPMKDNSFGASGTRFPNGVSADSTSPVAGQVRGATLSLTGDGAVGGGTFNITTANTATSTMIVGCIQTYATSTETPHRYQASTTPGLMSTVYGSCPNL